MKISQNQLTKASLNLFIEYIEDACNWGGHPWASIGNIRLNKEQRGNLTDLIKKELVITETDPNFGGEVLSFTSSGVELVTELGFYDKIKFWY